MNAKAKAAFASFGVLLALWLALSWLDKPAMADVATFIKGACFTAWTAAALFFEVRAADQVQPAQPAVAPTAQHEQPATDRPGIPGAHPEP